VRFKDLLIWESFMHAEPEGQNCGCGEVQKDEERPAVFIIRIAVAVVMTVLINIFNFPGYWVVVLSLISYLVIGYDIALKAFKNLIKGKVFDENFLLTVASCGAFLIGETTEAVAVLVFYSIGELLQEMAVDRSRKNIFALMDIRPDTANLKKGEKFVTIHPQEVEVGDIILVKPGEKIALDGMVIRGESFLDTMALTGESLPQAVKKKDTVLSGTLNIEGLMEIEVTKSYGESTVAKILELVETSGTKKAESEKFITKFAKVYTPAVVFIALAVILLPPLFNMGSFQEWLYRGLSFLIISCPCALVISIPLSFFSGIGAAAHKGILIKGGNYLESIKDLKTVVFDKTGTLTEGVFSVLQINTENNISTDELLHITAVAEMHSNHPVAQAIVKAYGKPLAVPVEITEQAGYGVKAKIGTDIIHVGSQQLLKKEGITGVKKTIDTAVHVAKNNEYLGHLIFEDKLKANAADELLRMRESGIEQLVVLSGDRSEKVAQIARELGIDNYHGELLPQDKVRVLEETMTKRKGITAFIGDGINDAPALKRADIGIAMGGIGSDAAVEAADVVIMNDDISKVADAVGIAKKTQRIVVENIVLALSVKTLIMILAFLGVTSIWLAIFADVGVALLALFNSLRIMGKCYYYK